MTKWYESPSIPESSWYNGEETPGPDTFDWVCIAVFCLLLLLIISDTLG